MTRVDFYILASSDESALVTLACRIAGKACNRGLNVHIHSGSPERARLLDDRLWTFSQSSFLPHLRVEAIRGEDDLARHPILIGVDEAPPGPCELLINMDLTVPSYFSRFDRVAEVVDAALDRRDAGRARYRFYRDRGYPLESHKL